MFSPPIRVWRRLFKKTFDSEFGMAAGDFVESRRAGRKERVSIGTLSELAPVVCDAVLGASLKSG